MKDHQLCIRRQSIESGHLGHTPRTSRQRQVQKTKKFICQQKYPQSKEICFLYWERV